jgi:hypothetical protein
MSPGLYRAMAAGVLSLHAAYILVLRVATLVYGMIVEILAFWCPLTALENWLEVRGGVAAYRGPFLLHYLDALVYPDIPSNLLVTQHSLFALPIAAFEMAI